MTHESSNASVSGQEEVVLAMTALKSFAAFEAWMDEQLEQLVAQWIHTAAPNANRVASQRQIRR